MTLYICSSCKTKKTADLFGYRYNTSERFKCCETCRIRSRMLSSHRRAGVNELIDSNTSPAEPPSNLNTAPEIVEDEHRHTPAPINIINSVDLPIEVVNRASPLINSFDITKNPFSNVNVDDIDSNSEVSLLDQPKEQEMRYSDVDA